MTIRTQLIPRIVVKLQSLSGVGSVFDHNVSDEKGSRSETIAVYIPIHVSEAESSCKVQVQSELKIKLISPSKASAEEHGIKLQMIEDAIEEFINEEIETPSGSNYSTINVSPPDIETDDEEDRDRPLSIMTFIIRYEYLRGQANVN